MLVTDQGGDLIEELIAAGMPTRLIARVAMLIARVEQDDKRRARDAERMRGVRERSRTFGTVQNVQNTENTDICVPSSPTKETKKERKKETHIRANVLPADFELNEADLNCAKEAGWDGKRVRDELVRFKDHAAAKGRKQVDWHASFRQWIRSPYQRAGPVNGERVPRPGSREDTRERTVNALRKLDLFGPDDLGGREDAGAQVPRRLPLAKPP